MPIDPADTGNLAADVSRRLVETRKALGDLTQEQFIEGTPISQAQMSWYESGRENRMITLKSALALCDRYPITLDWIYRGDPSNLPYKLWATIGKNRKASE